MEDFTLIIIIILKSDKSFGSGKEHKLDFCTKFYENGLDAI